MQTRLTSREALAELRHQFQLTPTQQSGGISVPFTVALGLCDELERALIVIEAASDYMGVHGHWPHDWECAHAAAHERGHYEGEFMKDRHWVYDESAKCDCRLGALSRALAGYENAMKAEQE